MARLIFCVTNDLNYDQRMARICGTLSEFGHDVLLVGREMPGSAPLLCKPYRQHRLNLLFSKGKGFYVEYQLRLFLFLLGKKADAVMAIDLDTIIPVYHAASLKGWKKAMDAHEYFTGQKEVCSRKAVYRIWKWIERKYLPKFRSGYTVSSGIAGLFREEYGLQYEVIRNLPLYTKYPLGTPSQPAIIIYRGAVNEARGLAELAKAMENIPARLYVYGTGNFMEAFQKIVADNNLTEKVVIKGAVFPEDLERATAYADIGVNLVENIGKNQYYSLANKFFDLVMHGIPQVTMDYPEYRAINDQFEVAVLIKECNALQIREAILSLINDLELYNRLANNCKRAAKVFNWDQEKMKLIQFYQKLLG